MKIFKLKDLKDCYVTVYSMFEEPKLYLVIPINEEEGVGILITQIADSESNSC